MAVRLELILAAGLLAWCLFGCAHGPGPVSKRLYDGPLEPSDELDTSGLKGRKIVIDPGHGGVFRGARGVAGLDEADANLGVARHLAGLLRDAGAVVTLTRNTDRDFVEGDSLRLRDDLRARVAIANDIDPDLFISLHHNADLKFDPAFNEIQVYHRLDDDGPSLDAAHAVAGRLLRNLGEDRCRVIGGNYHVLRNSIAPAVLCEPSFITNPDVESNLRSDEKQRLEAGAYFLGLVDYFSRGVPEISYLELRAPFGEEWPTATVTFGSLDAIDAASLELMLDGRPLEVHRIGHWSFAAWPPSPVAGGRHTISARARNVQGNSSRRVSKQFETSPKPATLSLRAYPLPGEATGLRKISALALDACGNAVADSTEVAFTWKEGAGLGTARRSTSRGMAQVYVGWGLPDVGQITARCGETKADLNLRVSPLNAESGPPKNWIAGFIADAAGHPLKDAAVSLFVNTSIFGWSEISRYAVTDAEGFFAVAVEGSTPTALEVAKPGYRSAVLGLGGAGSSKGAGVPLNIRLEPFYSSLDPAAVVAIDAAGGAALTERTGPEGVEASTLNLAVALRLESLLESVGVRALLTREGDDNITGETRVLRAEAARPALLISISHNSADAVASHYPGSTGGARVARVLAEEIRSSLGLEPRVAETADYIIQQPSCTAVKVEFPSGVGAGASASDPAHIGLRAHALMCGILRYLGVDDSTTFSIKGSVIADGRPCPGALIAVDGALEMAADAQGAFSLRLLERRSHTAEVIGVPGRHREMPRDPTEPGIQVVFDDSTGVLSLATTGWSLPVRR